MVPCSTSDARSPLDLQCRPPLAASGLLELMPTLGSLCRLPAASGRRRPYKSRPQAHQTKPLRSQELWDLGPRTGFGKLHRGKRRCPPGPRRKLEIRSGRLGPGDLIVCILARRSNQSARHPANWRRRDPALSPPLFLPVAPEHIVVGRPRLADRVLL